MKRKILKHVQKRAQEWGVDYPDNAAEILKKTKRYFKKKNIRICFSACIHENQDYLNANAGMGIIPIILNAEWAAHIVLKGHKPEVQNALLCTIGHELTHKDGDLYRTFRKKNNQFIFWVNEVHADYGSAQKMVNSERTRLLSAMEYKLSHKKSDTDGSDHPSWKRRIYYVKNFDTFGDELIDRISVDTQCESEELIAKAKKHFQEIHLR